MFKTILTVAIVCLVIAFFNDPNAVKPWGEAVGHVGGAITKGVEYAGKATSKEMKDIEHGNSIVNKVPDAITSAVGSVADAVTQK
jgi:hypothetical protein